MFFRAAMVVALSFTTVAGCWAGNNAGVTSAMDRQFSTAMLRVAQVEALLSEADGRIRQLEEVIRVQGRANATRLENLDEVNREVNRLRGDIEVLRHELESAGADLEVWQLSQERRQLWDEARLGQLEKLVGTTPPPPPDLGEAAVEAGGGVDVEGDVNDPTEPVDLSEGAGEMTELPEGAQGLLQLAIQRMEDGQQKAARVILQRANKDHPDAKEAAEISYRLAETWFNEEHWAKAAKQFAAVRTAHPDTPWWAWSTLRVGECFAKLGQQKDANNFYRHLIDERPQSEAAAEARTNLGR
jgi:TolA-binding protein